MVLTASGPSGDRPDVCSTTAVSRWVRCDAISHDVRRQNAGLPRLDAHFLHQLVARPVKAATRIALVGHDDVAHEAFDLPCNFAGALHPNIHHCIPCRCLRSIMWLAALQSTYEVATIDDDSRPGHVARGIGCQQQDRSVKILR